MVSASSEHGFFQVGGTLPADAAYVVRPADDQVLAATLSGMYCNVLTPRQTGKSSLMVRTMERLQQEGVRTARVDLTTIGTKVDPPQWYFGLMSQLKTELKLATDVGSWWKEHMHQGVVQRFSDFLRYVILEEITEPVVIFVDEIDSTLEVPFTDDFFAAIRAAYNARASDPVYKRLTFVLLGVARPQDLIKDRSRTPYNIGLSIDLTDFTLEEARALLPGLSMSSAEQAEAVLKRVLSWTGGFPYLTQKVCQHIAAQRDVVWTEEKVDRLVRRLFLSDEARNDENLNYLRRRIVESEIPAKLLSLYRQILSEKDVVLQELDPALTQLILAGLVKVAPSGALVVRNRVYKEVFDLKWIKATMPKPAGQPSQRSAVVTYGLVALIAITIGFFGGSAWYLASPLAAPIPILPLNGAVLDQTSDTISLNWSPVWGATNYAVEVEIDGLECCQTGNWCADAGREYHKSTVNSNGYSFPLANAPAQGRWRVGAVNIIGREGTRSNWQEFSNVASTAPCQPKALPTATPTPAPMPTATFTPAPTK